MKRLALRMILLSCSALAATGCIYKMNIQQGNYLVAESVSQLKEGMTRSQVRFLLGTPMVPDAFDEDRWDYYYFFNTRKYDKPLKRRLTVYFNDDKVQRYENLGVPTEADLQQLDKDLRKALAETKQKKPKQGLWKRMFSRDKAPEPVAPNPVVSDAAKQTRPDAVPPSGAQPAPAGTPSGPN